MKDYVYFIFVLVLVLLLTLAKVSNADPAIDHQLDDCKQTLHICDTAYNADEMLIKNLDHSIAVKDRYIQDLEKSLAESSVLPAWAWLLIGAGAGAAAVGVLK